MLVRSGAVMSYPQSPALCATETQFPHFVDVPSTEKQQQSIWVDETVPGRTKLGPHFALAKAALG